MPKGIYERDPLDKDHLSTGISLGQVQAKLEKEFAELEEKKKIRAEIDRDHLKSEIYQSRDKIEQLRKENAELRQENSVLRKAMRIDEQYLHHNQMSVCGQ